MRAYLELISVPTVDTPGTLLMLHFDDQRYLIGHLSEGTSRACIQHGLGLRNVTNVLLSGKMRWSNIGGLLGMVLGMADVKRGAAEAAVAEKLRKRQNQRDQTGANDSSDNSVAERQQVWKEEMRPLQFYGASNLNYAIATARRFIFRTGMPLDAVELGRTLPPTPDSDGNIPSTWSDNRVQVWAMPIFPHTSSLPNSRSRKRSHDELENACNEDLDSHTHNARHIVNQMFNSGWHKDRLTPKPLSEVQLPATIFLQDTTDGSLKLYQGPLPGGPDPVPDIEVLVREPWPASLSDRLQPTTTSEESICYIIRGHPRRGKFLPNKAQELGIPPGTDRARLAKGFSVKNPQGEEILPEMVLEPGRDGNGFAVLDIPDSVYIDSLLSRPEWHSPQIVAGIHAMIWILGPYVVDDPRIHEFQSRHAKCKQLVIAPEMSAHLLPLETPSTYAWRHNSVDPIIFPAPMVDSSHLLSRSHSTQVDTSTGPARPMPYTQPVNPGLILNLEPEVTINEKDCREFSSAEKLMNKSHEELQELFQEDSQLTHFLNADCDLKSISNESSAHSGVEITTLGTGSSHPMPHRNVSSVLLRIPGCGSYLFDCGEGTLGSLRRMYNADELTSVLKDLRMIWVSHLHADHHLGTTSVIKAWHRATFSKGQQGADANQAPSALSQPKLAIVSDLAMLNWVKEYSNVEDIGISRLLLVASKPTAIADETEDATATHSSSTLTDVSLSAPEDHLPSILDKLNLSWLRAVRVNHCRGAQAISVRTKTGFKFSYSGDCRPSAEFAKVGADSDVLVHEATLEDGMQKEAYAKKHTTVSEALVVALEMKAKSCILTHFSQRYPLMPPLGSAGNPTFKAEGTAIVPPNILETVDSQYKELPTSEDSAEPLDNPEYDAGMKTMSSNLRSVVVNHGPQYLGGGAATASLLARLGAENLLRERGMGLIFAWDYMRLKVGDIGRLQSKQPVIRALYEKLNRKGESEFAHDDLDTRDQTVAVKTNSNKQKNKSQQKQKEKKQHPQPH